MSNKADVILSREEAEKLLIKKLEVTGVSLEIRQYTAATLSNSDIARYLDRLSEKTHWVTP